MTHAHEAHEHLGHTKVPKAPRETRHDGDEPVLPCRSEQRCTVLDDLVARRIENRGCNLRTRKESGDILQESDRVINATRLRDAANEHRGEREEHERALDEVGRADGEISADERVEEHDDGTEDHHRRVVEPEERREQLTASHKAASRVNREEDERDDGRNRHEDMLVVVKAVREEVGDGDGVVRHLGVLAQTLRHELPIEIRADSKADRRPHGVRRAREVCNAGKAHEQPPGHVRRFRGKRREPRAKPATAEEVRLARGVRLLRIDEADEHNDDEIQKHRQEYPKITSNHFHPSQ